MSTPPAGTQACTSPLELFSAEVTRLRNRLYWTQKELATKLGFSDALVGYVENGIRMPTERFATACDAVFGTDYLIRLCLLVRQHGTPAAPLSQLLADTTQIRTCDPLFVPELARTPDYSAALEEGRSRPEHPDTPPTWVRLVDLLTANPHLSAWIVIDQIALHRQVGGNQVLLGQLAALLDLIDTGRVYVQVLPIERAQESVLLHVPVTLLSFPGAADVAYLPGGDSQTFYFVDAAPHNHAFDVLSATAMAPGLSRGLIANALK